MAAENILYLRIGWKGGFSGIGSLASEFYHIDVLPEPEFPFGRKGMWIAGAWRQLADSGTAGALFLDGDVVIDPVDLEAMNAAISADVRSVHVAPVKLWPASTKLDDWVWGHGAGRFTKNPAEKPLNMFTFSFTYLPESLITESLACGLEDWVYPNVDEGVREVARDIGTFARVVAGCYPKHVNWG